MFKHLTSFSLLGLLSFTTLAYSQTAPAEVRTTGLASGPCSGTFVKRTLDHTTRARGAEVTFYDSNGAGVAAGDLDNDGDIDLVLANLNGNNTILWNEGALSFRKEAFAYGNSRAVNLVDVDGDGFLDIVSTQSLSAPSYWHNVQRGSARTFRQEALKGVTRKAYAMAWADLDADGDLDLVTASYDALLEKDLRDSFLFSAGAGVVVYENTPAGFKETRLADSSQALALTLFDVDDDGKLDIVVGNDFEVPDYVYLNSDGGWRQAAPFGTTTRNTMSFDAGDIDNDGSPELFATDMKPDFSNTKALAAWTPLLEKSYRRKTSKNVQREENVLYKRFSRGFKNLAYGLKLDATGWSWSGTFGDLDNDGFLDLYVVNGMIAKEVFAHLPGNELVEPNHAFRNTGGRFEERPDWGLGALESGRGMTMADLDNDGDLDIVVNNLASPALLFENQLCSGNSLEVDLAWPGSGNTRALGAVLTLTGAGGTFSREVKSGSGYLSGAASRVHFGVPAAGTYTLNIRWPDGYSSEASLTTGTRATLSRTRP